MVSLYARTDEKHKFSFDNDNVAYSIAEFLTVAKTIDVNVLRTKISDKSIEHWEPLVSAGKSEQLTHLREKIERHEVENGRRELLAILCSSAWLWEHVKQMRKAAGWRFWFRIVVIAILLGIGLAVNSWVFYAPGIVVLCLVVSGYAIGALTLFKPDRDIPKSTYDGLKFAVELLTGITGAMLALISTKTGFARIAAVSLALSVVLGVFAVYNVITAAEYEENNSVGINSASWDWIETLILFQFLAFIAGGVALTLNVLS